MLANEETRMPKIVVEVVAVRGICNAGLEVRNAFTFEGFEPPCWPASDG
jgi:hypothetical protein